MCTTCCNVSQRGNGDRVSGNGCCENVATVIPIMLGESHKRVALQLPLELNCCYCKCQDNQPTVEATATVESQTVLGDYTYLVIRVGGSVNIPAANGYG